MKNLYLITFLIVLVIITGCKPKSNSAGSTVGLPLNINITCGQGGSSATKCTDGCLSSELTCQTTTAPSADNKYLRVKFFEGQCSSYGTTSNASGRSDSTVLAEATQQNVMLNAGTFTWDDNITHIPQGTYSVRFLIDMNNNGQMDDFEPTHCADNQFNQIEIGSMSIQTDWIDPTSDEKAVWNGQ